MNYDDCFWISKEYYQDACNFYKRRSDTDSELSTPRNKTNTFTPVIDAKQFHTNKIDKVRISEQAESD